jgi:hypothetical protein
MTPAATSTEARIDTIEARMDGRVSSVEATFAGLSKLMDERQQVSDARMDRIEAMLAEIRSAVAGLPTTIWVAAVSSVLAIVLGVAGFTASLSSNIFAAFESAANISSSQAEVKRQTEETAILLKKIQQDMDDHQARERK